METSVSLKKKKQYIRLERFGNLYVIPYLRGRLVFAELAARALEEDGFEQVIVDLPYFMIKGGVWEEAIKLFPHVSSLLIKKTDGTHVTLPFVPNDAACISLAAVQLLREWGRDIELACIDDSQVIHYPAESMAQPEIRMHDDYFVFTEGLKEYYRDAYQQLEETWEGLSGDQQFFSEYRAGLVAERLRGKAGGGKKTLFVCEYRLWWLVKKILLSAHPVRRQYFKNTWKDVKAALVIEEPLELWARGALDDYPSAVLKFYKDIQNGKVASFDKLLNIKTLISKTLNPSTQRKSGGMSIRRIVSFYKFLNNRVTSSLRHTPLPINHLYDTAYACLGKNAARDVAKKFLRYPYPGRRELQRSLNIREDDIVPLAEALDISLLEDHRFYNTGSMRYSHETLYHDYIFTRKRKKVIYQVYPSQDSRLCDSLGRYKSHSWAVQADYLLHELACRKVREFVARNNRQMRIKKSWGRVGEGIHWKATIAAKDQGKQDVYIKYKCRASDDNRKKINEHTPVVFIFADDFSGHKRNVIHDSNITQRKVDLGNSRYIYSNDPPPDAVYSVFYTSSGGKNYYSGHVSKRFISSLAFLYTRHIMGLVRYAAITKRPYTYQCRTEPHYYPETENFPLSEMGVAWAINYAEHTVIVVAREGWKTSKGLSDFARKKGIHIISLPLSRFTPDFISRMRILFFTSTQLKKHPDRDAIVDRFID